MQVPRADTFSLFWILWRNVDCLPLNMMLAVIFFFVDFLYHGKKFNSILPSVRVLSCMWIGFCQIHMFCLLCWSYGFLFFCAKTAWYCFDKFYLVKLFNSSSMNLYDLLIFCWEFLHCFLAILLQLTIFSLLLIVFSW